MPADLRQRIAERWRGYCDRYGYDLSPRRIAAVGSA
jgi:hypothetical protein